MNRDAVLLVVLGFVVVAVLIGVGLGGVGSTRTVSESGPAVVIPDPPADGSSGVVYSVLKQDGQRIFGIALSSTTYIAHIGFVAPAQCTATDEKGLEVLRSDGECAELPARGEITGNGVTITGDSFVIVRTKISEECFDALSVGEAWPTADGPCSQ